MSSALGIWLLLAACAAGADGENRHELEEALGCSAEEAGELLAAFMVAPPQALNAGIAAWVQPADATAAFNEWVRSLPERVESGSVPSQVQPDEWARRTTLGLIEKFAIDPLARIVLGSAVATRVSWATPFDVVDADEHLGAASPWRGKVRRLLWDSTNGPLATGPLAAVVDTRSAGVVVAHFAVAHEDLTVMSVSAAPGVPRGAVLEAAHELTAALHNRQLSSIGVSLFDLPLGDGHSWTISEHETDTFRAGDHEEKIEAVSLPAWDQQAELKLMIDGSFGCRAAVNTLRELIGPRPEDPTEGKQKAIARFSRYGFEAAAIVDFLLGRAMEPVERGIERSVVLRFDHPYAAVAVAGKLNGWRDAFFDTQARFSGLPLFTAWVTTPVEPENHVEDADRRIARSFERSISTADSALPVPAIRQLRGSRCRVKALPTARWANVASRERQHRILQPWTLRSRQPSQVRIGVGGKLIAPSTAARVIAALPFRSQRVWQSLRSRSPLSSVGIVRRRRPA